MVRLGSEVIHSYNINFFYSSSLSCLIYRKCEALKKEREREKKESWLQHSAAKSSFASAKTLPFLRKSFLHFRKNDIYTHIHDKILPKIVTAIQRKILSFYLVPQTRMFEVAMQNLFTACQYFKDAEYLSAPTWKHLTSAYLR